MHPRLIRSPGSYDVFGGSVRMQVRDDGWRVRYFITVGSHGAATPDGFDSCSHWFIHPANSTDTWVYDGQRDLMRLQLIDGQLLAQTTHSDPRLLEHAPALVSSRVRRRYLG